MIWLRKKQGSTSRDGKAQQKRIRLEPLETRCLLAADSACIASFDLDHDEEHEIDQMEDGLDHDADDAHGRDDDAHDHDTHEHEHDVEIHHDSYGSYYIDDPFVAEASVGSTEVPIVDSAWAEFDSDALPIRIEDVPKLHSNPNASQKIYLDFTGQRISRTGWNENNTGKTIGAPPFDVDNDTKTFNALEQHTIESVWSRVSEDFSPFDIDVTTESPAARDFTEGSQAIRVLISSNVDELSGKRWFDNVGGVAYIGSWRFESDTPVWVFSNVLGGHEKRIAEAISHEVGHSLGLDHDGTQEKEYFSGFGDGETSWAPIMGSGSGRVLTQWSRGEYDEANNGENDLSIIASAQNQINFRVDDHSSNFFSPTPLIPNSDGTVAASGLISTSTDKDIFMFETEVEGLVDLTVQGPGFGSNLDIQLTIYDQNVNILGTINPHDQLTAEINANLPAGKYYLRVDGVGRGDPKSDGYSAYGSIGQYTVSGSLPVTVDQSSNLIAAPEVATFGFADFLVLADAYGTQVTPTTKSADLDDDGRIDFSDFLILSAKYGS